MPRDIRNTRKTPVVRVLRVLRMRSEDPHNLGSAGFADAAGGISPSEDDPDAFRSWVPGTPGEVARA